MDPRDEYEKFCHQVQTMHPTVIFGLVFPSLALDSFIL